MSLYREPGRRGRGAVAVGAVIGLTAGLAIGLAVGSGGDDEASLADSIAELQSELQPALSELELVQIEYTEAVRAGEVSAESEYQASVQHLAGARETLDSASAELEALSPDGSAAAERSLDELDRLVDDAAPSARVAVAVRRADAAIRAAARIE